YGVSLGACFFGESMFSDVSNASKVAAAALVRQVSRWNFPMIDSQIHNDHLASLGAREIPRVEYLQRLQSALQHDTRKGVWTFDGW
ncbi:MAG TPA: leucyl/phenylalanyl-tRNA--protein transferase, partial [Candidatus Hydrogenedentes bacterium]|nr:leucyl/phenylalanyl-tRNA--protein transferase [Candidatus Hydrogenedentota bacterium]